MTIAIASVIGACGLALIMIGLGFDARAARAYIYLVQIGFEVRRCSRFRRRLEHALLCDDLSRARGLLVAMEQSIARQKELLAASKPLVFELAEHVERFEIEWRAA